MSHFRKVCEHGKVISQCRCPGPKTDQVVQPCPFPEHAVDTERALYAAAAQRYAFDAEFHARAVRVEHLAVESEPQLVEEARFPLRWGAALALHLVDTGVESAHPVGGKPGDTRYQCMFRECGWTLAVPGASTWASADGVFLRPETLLRLHNGAVERDIRAHLLDEHRLAIETLAGLL